MLSSLNSIKGQQNFDGSSAGKEEPVNCTDFKEETVRLYLDFVHDIKQSHEKIGFNQLIELIRFLADMGKIGNDSYATD